MTDKYDFEHAIRDLSFERRWLCKFSKCLDEAVGGYIRNQVMEKAAGTATARGLGESSRRERNRYPPRTATAGQASTRGYGSTFSRGRSRSRF